MGLWYNNFEILWQKSPKNAKKMKFAFPLRIKFLNMLYNEGVMYMKDFCKWLGVSEKFAKVVVWIFILMSFLIVTNVMLESIGLPFYKLTVENLSKIDYPKVLEYILAWIITLLDFYTVIFLIFPIKDFGKIFKYSILYLILNIIVFNLFGNGVLQIFIVLFMVIFSYLYSNKNKKYILYGIIGYILSLMVQYICYLYKIRFIDFTTINTLNKMLVSLDYVLLMFIIILVKEIIIKNKKKKE